MLIAIRVDASAKIGTGHVRRMLSLAMALRKYGAEILFVTRDLGLDSAALIQNAGFAANILPAPNAQAGAFSPDPTIPHSAWAEVPLELEIAQSVAALANIRPDWVVVDSYALDARWHSQVAQQLGTRMAVIDDLADRSLAADLLVDHNFHPDHHAKFAGRLDHVERLLAGPSYAMIGPVYEEAPRYTFHDTVRSVGIFLGGVDAEQDTLRTLKAADEAGWHGTIEVVSTSANPNLADLQRAIASRPGALLSLDLPDLAAFFGRHDLQIGAGGGAIWERCCIGPPTIGLVCAANQTKSIPFAHKAGFLFGIDHMRNPPQRHAALVTAIRTLIAAQDKRRSLSQTAMQLVDGRGTQRIAKAIIKED